MGWILNTLSVRIAGIRREECITALRYKTGTWSLGATGATATGL
jgi:hypothetical protein